MATAAGDIIATGNALRSICLLTGVTANNGAPSAATAGVPGYATARVNADAGANYTSRPARESTIFIKGVATGGSVALTPRLWGYNAAIAVWVPVGTGADADKGKLNGGTALGPTKTNTVLHSERLLNLGQYDRLYLEILAIAGTGTTVEAWLTTSRLDQVS